MDPGTTKMIELMKELGVPLAKDVEELKKYMTEYGIDPSRATSATKVKAQLNNPRIPIFFGEEGKGEVSYHTWANEVKCLKRGTIFPDEVVIQSVRRSLRGNAADQLRYIGEDPTIEEILQNFESTYGTIETAESILKKFFACKQGPSESVVNYCMRLEEIHAKAVEMKEVNAVEGKLKRVFYKGLNTNLKHLSAFKFEMVKDYKDFKREVRQIEDELEEDTNRREPTEVKVRCHAANKKEVKEEKSKTEQQLGDLVTMMDKLNSRLENLEKGQQGATCFQQTPQRDDQSTEQAQSAFQQIPTRQYQSQQYTPQASQYTSQYSSQSQYPRQGQTNTYNDQTQDQNYYPPQFRTRDQNDYQPQQPYSYRPVGWRGPKHFRGARSERPRGQGPFRGQGRGDTSYRFSRPIAGSTFQPECWSCHQRGHMARDCSLNK